MKKSNKPEPESKKTTPAKKECSATGTSTCRCIPGTLEEKTATCSNMNDRASVIRKLWMDHAWFTESYVQAAIFKLATASHLKTRLVANQKEIGDEFAKLFPKVISSAQGTQMGEWLKAHITKADAAVSAAISAGPAKLKSDKKFLEAQKDLFEQGEEMANAIACLLDESASEELQTQFHTHNQHVLTLASILLEKKFNKYVEEVDGYLNHMIMVSNMLVCLASRVEESL